MKGQAKSNVSRLNSHVNRTYMTTRGGDTVEMTWQSQAVCKELIELGVVSDGTLFPFTKREHAANETFRREVCGRCPVARECLEFALENGYAGTWGGRLLTEADVREERGAA